MKRPPDKLLTCYVVGEVSPEERAEVDAWLAANPAARAHVERLSHCWQSARQAGAVEEGAWDTEQKWATLAGRLDVLEGPEQATTQAAGRLRDTSVREHRRPKYRPAERSAAKRRARYRPAIGAVAALLVAVATGYLLVQSSGLSPASKHQKTPIVYAAARGERSVLRLADGTTVHLAPASRLTVDPSFSKGSRRHVEIEGRGYFDVAPDSAHPFIVSTEHATTRVLGTSFNVSAYPNSRDTEVLVVEGRVAVQSRDRTRPDSVVLAPGQYATVAAGAGTISVETADDIRAYTAWVDGQLAFWDVPFQEVLRELERWYDFEGTVADSELADRPVTALFDGGETLQETLVGLEMALGIRYAQKDSARITFYDAPPSRDK